MISVSIFIKNKFVDLDKKGFNKRLLNSAAKRVADKAYAYWKQVVDSNLNTSKGFYKRAMYKKRNTDGSWILGLYATGSGSTRSRLAIHGGGPTRLDVMIAHGVEYGGKSVKSRLENLVKLNNPNTIHMPIMRMNRYGRITSFRTASTKTQPPPEWPWKVRNPKYLLEKVRIFISKLDLTKKQLSEGFFTQVNGR